jgi:hypothetical protein
MEDLDAALGVTSTSAPQAEEPVATDAGASDEHATELAAPGILRPEVVLAALSNVADIDEVSNALQQPAPPRHSLTEGIAILLSRQMALRALALALNSSLEAAATLARTNMV